MTSISIIIPAYNEETIIQKILDNLKEILRSRSLDYEIIVVNDGSTDKTEEIVKAAPGVKLINHSFNQGYGAALKTGISQARYDAVCIIDADGTYPPQAISELAEYIPQYDMVVGARTKKNAQISLIRKPAKWLINQLANYLSGTKIPDLNSGLRIMKKSFVEKFFYILPNGFSFTTTITLAAVTNNHPVKYIPIDYYKRLGKSKIRPIRDTLNFIQLIVRTVLYFSPLKIFITLSAVVFILGVIIFFYGLIFVKEIFDTTVAVLVISSVQLLAIGMIADLITKTAFKRERKI